MPFVPSSIVAKTISLAVNVIYLLFLLLCTRSCTLVAVSIRIGSQYRCVVWILIRDLRLDLRLDLALLLRLDNGNFFFLDRILPDPRVTRSLLCRFFLALTGFLCRLVQRRFSLDLPSWLAWLLVLLFLWRDATSTLRIGDAAQTSHFLFDFIYQKLESNLT